MESKPAFASEAAELKASLLIEPVWNRNGF